MWVLAQGATFIVDLELYEAVRVAGAVQRLRIDPGEGVLNVVVSDGTGCVSARWSITRPTPQLTLVPPRRVALEGIVVRGSTGDLVLPEPRFETFASDRLVRNP